MTKNLDKIIKIIANIFAATILLTTGFTCMYANAAVRYDEVDNLFLNTLKEVLDYEEAESVAVSTQKEMLYDISLNEVGILYQFTYGDNEGFAILIDDGNEIKVTEIYSEAISPYPDNVDQKIYVMENIYWYLKDEQIYDCISELPISPESIELVSESAYRGAMELHYDSEQINFLYRSQTPYNILSSIPLNYYGKENGCVPVAGTNLIMYYDRYYPNLLPNYEPGELIFNTLYRYNDQDNTTRALSDTLYDDMGTTTSSGTTIPKFKSGMKKYVNRQGYNISFESLVSWGKLKFDRAKTVVQEKKAIALFIKGYRCTVITTNDGNDVLNYEYANGNHAVAGFGCLEVNYTFADNSTRQDRYIQASVGVGIYRKGYINVNSNIDDALAITIS